MRENNVQFEALHEEPPGTEKNSPDDDHSEHEHGGGESSQSRSEDTTEAKNIWQAMRQGYRDPSDTFYDNIFNMVNTHDQAYTTDENMLFGSRQSTVELHTLHPEPAQLFRLWQVYLDNVNPLLKVTHTPTLQSRIVEAVSDLKNISPPLETLMFGIYCTAVLSLTEEECQTMFKQPKEQLSTKFQFGSQQALVNSQFLRTGDRDCLTGLYLYLVAVRSASHPKSISSMLAVAIRIAERMGLPVEARNARCSVLEAEMRRRLWWSLVLFDSRVSSLGDHKMSTLNPTWDCALPTNVSDSELREEIKTPPKPQRQATEATFSVMRSETGDWIRNSPYYIAFTNPVMKALAKKLPDNDTILENELQEKFLQFCDCENRLHFMTFWTGRASMATRRLMKDYLTYLDPKTEYTPAHHEAAVAQAIEWLECDTQLSISPLTKGFHWFLRMFFPFPAYVRIIHYVKSQPFNDQIERMWQVMHDNYTARAEPDPFIRTPVFVPFANIIVFAWDTIKKTYEKAGKEAKAPELVDYINQKIAEMSLGATEHSEGQSQGPVGMDLDDVAMSIPFGFGDSGALFNMGGQDGFGGGFPYMPDQIQSVDTTALSWNMMGWGSGGGRTW
ncbi:C6 transcription factor [Fusarium heterosporum]|uniref:C6 transcription factor n=1 Tax=Fusarium heterosporum TaxID=42747 RepID=A0A8H5U412_FUSHE|nr:C6 transcription factor [Fusarium heterosporum]